MNTCLKKWGETTFNTFLHLDNNLFRQASTRTRKYTIGGLRRRSSSSPRSDRTRPSTSRRGVAEQVSTCLNRIKLAGRQRNYIYCYFWGTIHRITTSPFRLSIVNDTTLPAGGRSRPTAHSEFQNSGNVT